MGMRLIVKVRTMVRMAAGMTMGMTMGMAMWTTMGATIGMTIGMTMRRTVGTTKGVTKMQMLQAVNLKKETKVRPQFRAMRMIFKVSLLQKAVGGRLQSVVNF